MNILITGGYGFIGSNLIIHLLNHYPSYKILNIDSKTYASNHNNLKFLKKYRKYSFKKIDINNYNKLNEIILKFKPNIIFNLAAESHVDNSIENSKKFIQTNIVGTYNLLNISKNYYKRKSKNFLFFQVSTDEVYGDLNKNDNSFTEDSNIKPSSPYSASKASADHLVQSFFRTYNLPTIISRCSNNYGPYQYKEKLIPKIIFNVLKNKFIPVYNKGEEVRDWIHVSDHIDALITLSKKGKFGHVYNIGSNNEIKNIILVKKILKIIKNKTQKSINYKKIIKFVKDRPGHDFRYSINSNKIYKRMNWKSKINFEKGLEETVEWYLNYFKFIK